MDYGPAPESTKEAQAWLEQHGRTFGLFIDNAWTAGAETFASNNPADGKELAQVSQASSEDVDRAVAAARRAQPGWVALGGHGRARVLYALARLLQKHARLFAVVETLDNGKTIRETRDADLPLAARHFYHHAGWAQLQWTQKMAPLIMGAPSKPGLTKELLTRFQTNDPDIARHFARVAFTADHRAELPKSTVPALVLQCSDDLIAPREVGEYIHRHLPNSTLAVIDNIGHCPHLSSPEVSSELIDDYLARLGY